MRRLALTLIGLLWAASLSAQPIDSGTISTAGSDCSVVLRCVAIKPGNVVAVTVTVTGSMTGTLQFEGSADSGTTWTSALAVNLATGAGVTSTTAAGSWSISNPGWTNLRVRASALSSGTPVVYFTRGFGVARWLAPFLLNARIGDDVSLINTASDLGGATEVATGAVLYLAGAPDTGLIVADQVRNPPSNGSGVVLRRARGTASTPLDVANSDQLGYIDFRGYSGTKFWQMGSIAAHVDGTFTSGQAPPSRIIFATNAANGASTQRMQIDKSGHLLINTQGVIAPVDGAMLQVAGTANDWTAGVRAAPSSGAAYGMRIHSVPATAADYMLALSSGAGAGTIYVGVNGLGNMAVGKLAPTARLDVDGDVKVSAAAITAGAHATVTAARLGGGFITTAVVTATTCNAQFKLAGTTADCTIATFPAKTKLVGVYADVTAGFTCSGTCTGTKTIGAGISAGGTEILAAGLSIATTNTQYGLADADLGTAMQRAAAIQGGYLPSWSATTDVIVRFTSGTGNWGDGSVTYINAGSVTFYLETVRLP